MKERLIEWLWRNFIMLVTVLCLVIYMFTYLENCFGPPIRADGEGYYAYLPSWFIHHDIGFSRLAERRFGGDIPAWTGIERHAATGRYLNRFNMGVALLAVPFFLAGHGLTWWFRSPPGGFDWWRFNHALDGYSFFYQHAAGLAGVCYFVLGFGLLKRLLSCHFSKGVVLAVLSVLLFGTNLLHYGSGETVFSTPYSFFLFSCFLFATRAWHKQPSWRFAVAVGLLAGLIVLVRTNNALFLVTFPLYGVLTTQDLSDVVGRFRRRWLDLTGMALVAAAVFAPQLLVWRAATGRWVVYSYGGYGFDFARPHIAEVLFSLNRGLFFWCPALVFFLPGMVKVRSAAKDYLLACAVYLPLQLYVVASWCQWWWGGSFGHRAFVEAYALVAFPMAAFFASLRSPAARRAVTVAAVIAVAWTLFFMKLYYTRELSYYGLDAQALFDIFWLRKEALRAWARGLL